MDFGGQIFLGGEGRVICDIGFRPFVSFIYIYIYIYQPFQERSKGGFISAQPGGIIWGGLNLLPIIL